MYPFEGRQVHEIMAALLAYRLGKIQALSVTMAMNDYGFELVSDQHFPIDMEILKKILDKKNLMEDILLSINATEMARRKFRDIARVSGLVVQRSGRRALKWDNIQASSNIVFNVLEQSDPGNLLLKQAYTEVFDQQLEEPRIRAAFQRIQDSVLILKELKQFTPLSFPIKVDSLRQSLSSEDLAARIQRMKDFSMKTK